MPRPPQRYPNLDEGKLDHMDPWARTQRLYGAGDPKKLFTSSPKTTTPWPQVGRTKGEPLYRQDLVNEALSQPRKTVNMDPRYLHATQPYVTEEGVDYYHHKSEYEKTGRTFADQDRPGNRTPVVYSDRRGRNLILSGHHRATSALLKGGQFEAIHVEEKD